MPVTPRTWVNVPPGTTPPPDAPKWNAATIQEWEDFLTGEVEGHMDASLEAHGGLLFYVSASSYPPANPPTGLPWFRTDTEEVVKNVGTPSVPVWDVFYEDPYKLTTSDLVTDYVITGLLPSVPASGLSLSIPAGAAIVSGRRVAKASATAHLVPAGKSTLVDLSSSGAFTNVDNGVLLDDGEDVWAEKTDSDFTQSIIAGGYSVGNAVRFAIGAGAAAGDFVTEAIDTTDLSVYGKLKVRIRSSVAVTSGQLQLMLDNSPQCASPVQTLDVPALTANTWTEVEVPYNSGAAGISAIISIGLKYTVDVGAVNVDIEDIWAVKGTEPAVTANSIRLFEARADRDIAQVETVDIVTVTNSAVYTYRINGVDITFTSDASATAGEIALGLVAAINASTNPAVTPVTAATTALATDASATFTVTADVPGVPFTVLPDAKLSTATTVPNSTSNVVAVTDRQVTSPEVRGVSSVDIADLTGVNIVSPAAGDVLKFDGTQWVNDESSGGGGPYWSTRTGSGVIYAGYGYGEPQVHELLAATIGANTSANSVTTNTNLRANGFILPRDFSLASIRLWTLFGYTNWLTMGIYRASDGALLYGSSAVSTVANGWTIWTLPSALSLSKNTLYYIAWISASNQTGTVFRALQLPNTSNYYSGANSPFATINDHPQPVYRSAGIVSGTLPDPMGTVLGNYSASTIIPLLYGTAI